MITEFFLHFPEGLPHTTSQMKGERIRYKFDPKTKKPVPYIDHYRKPEVQILRNKLTGKMFEYRPKQPSEKPIRLTVILYFNIKAPKKIWGKHKTTKPDCDSSEVLER